MRYLLACCFLFLLVGCQPTKSKDVKTETEGNKNHNFSFVDLNGGKVELSDFKGKKVLVNYWATWCAPCKKEMPALLRAQELLQSSNYVFLLVSDESIEKISNFKTKTNYDFKFLKLNESIEKLGIYMLPTTFIYNEKGEEIKKIVGAVEWDSEEMINTLNNI